MRRIRRGGAPSIRRAGGRARGRTWWFGILLGGLLVAAGIAETVRLVRSGDGGFAFWFGTLVGGGVLVLTGTLLLPRKPVTGCVLTTIGCVAGLLPTMWTVVVPLMLMALSIVTVKQAAAAVDRDATPGQHTHAAGRRRYDAGVGPVHAPSSECCAVGTECEGGVREQAVREPGLADPEPYVGEGEN